MALHTVNHLPVHQAQSYQQAASVLSPNQWLIHQNQYQYQPKPSAVVVKPKSILAPPRNRKGGARTRVDVDPHSYSSHSAMTPSIATGRTGKVSQSPVRSVPFRKSAVSPLHDIDAKAAAAAERELSKLGICRYYGSAMGCKWGENCLRSHSDPNSVPFCRYFTRSTGCLLGMKCTFRHEEYPLYPVPNDKGDDVLKCPVISPLKEKNKVYRHPIDSINRIDSGLATYYRNCGRRDYYNEDGKGKFVEFVMREKWNKSTLIEALGTKTKSSNRTLWREIDPDFPSPVIESGPGTGNRSDVCDDEVKYRVLRRCMLYGSKSCCVALKMEEGGCYHLDRMLDALEFYAAMDLNDKEHQQRFMEFIKTRYSALCWDFMHILEHHGDGDILKEAAKFVDNLKLNALEERNSRCNVANCLLMFRQKMDLDILKYSEQGDGSKDELLFYRDLMDSMHCLLAHGYDIGIKIKIGDEKEVKAMKWKDPLYGYMSTVQCGKEEVHVFSTQWCMTRNHL